MHQTFWSWRRQGAVFLIGQILVGWILIGLGPVRAKGGGQVVISGFQVSGGSGRTNEEYVEIFNSSGEVIDLGGWRLAKLTKTGVMGSWTYLGPGFATGTSLAAFSFAVAVHNDAKTLFDGDWYYASSTLAEDNSVALLNTAGDVVDLIGWGQSVNFSDQVLPTAGTGRWSRDLLPDNTLGLFSHRDGGPRQGKVVDLPVTLEAATSTELLVENTTTVVEVTTGTPANMVEAVLVTPQNILISEVYPQPDAGQSEYVELYNPNETEIELDGWRLVEGGGSETVVTGTIPSNGFRVVSPIKGSLNNTGDAVVLWHGNEKVDEVAYGEWEGATLSPSKGQSVARLELLIGNNWLLGKVTSGELNLIWEVEPVVDEEVVIESSSNIKSPIDTLEISEVLPDPVGPDIGEFIELYNATSRSMFINLWRLEVGEQEFIIPSQTVASGAYVVLFREQSKLVLPNLEKQKIRLLRSDGTVSDSVSYTVPAIGGAVWINAVGRGWEWSQSSTPGLANEWKRLNRPPYAEITAPAEVGLGEVVNFESDNVYDPDQDLLEYYWDLGDGQTSTGTGIGTVYTKAGKYKVALKVIDMFGLSDQTNWTVRVLAPDSNQSVVSTSTTANTTTKKVAASAKGKTTKSNKVAAVSVSAGPARSIAARLLAENDGRLVSIKGTITSGSGKYWRLDDGTDEVVIILPTAKQPSGFGFKKGTVWQVTGVVKKYKEDWAVASTEWSQLQMVSKVATVKNISGMPISRNKVVVLWWLLGGLMTVVLVSLFIKRRKQSALIPLSVV